ncbi:hypothetical protein D12LOC_04214 [Dickeya solani]|nr:hypothetical protein [Dickeya solani]
MTHVEQRAPQPGRQFTDFRYIRQFVVQTGGQIHAALQRLTQHRYPGIGNDAAAVRHADHQRLRARRAGGGDVHIRQSAVRPASRHAVLADAVFRMPLFDANRHFGGQLIVSIAKKQQIRFFYIHHRLHY